MGAQSMRCGSPALSMPRGADCGGHIGRFRTKAAGRESSDFRAEAPRCKRRIHYGRLRPEVPMTAGLDGEDWAAAASAPQPGPTYLIHGRCE
jgi:hypothetical protein